MWRAGGLGNTCKPFQKSVKIVPLHLTRFLEREQRTAGAQQARKEKGELLCSVAGGPPKNKFATLATPPGPARLSHSAGLSEGQGHTRALRCRANSFVRCLAPP